MAIRRDLTLALRIKRHGGRNSLRVVWEAQRAHIPISLLCAFLTQESNFQNVFGHDGVANPVKGGEVNARRYREYKRFRNAGFGCQGVGPMQLTFQGYQDQADRIGGCWKPRHNIRVGAQVIRQELRSHSTVHAAVAAYNGTGPAAEAYATSVLALQELWHKRLVP